jgi:hypothetical protein
VLKLPNVIWVGLRLPKGYSGLTMSRVRLGYGWVRKIQSRVRQIKLAGLLRGYPGWLRVTRAILMHYRPKVSLSQGGRPTRKFLGEAS